MSALLVAALLLAGEEESYTRRWTASAACSVLVPGNLKDVAVTGSFEVGFEPFAFLRLFNFGTAAPLPSAPSDPWRILVGLEGIVSPVLPLETSLGAAFGLGRVSVCGITSCFAQNAFTVQARVFAGYRFVPWLTMGALVSWNTFLGPGSSWFELGPRVSVRW